MQPPPPASASSNTHTATATSRPSLLSMGFAPVTADQ